MTFDTQTRNRLAGLVADFRDLLMAEFDAQLQEFFGIYAGEGRMLDLNKLPHLDDERLRTAGLLRERINHVLATEPTGGLKEAVKRVLREQAFTVVNRFVALRMAEERGLLVEAVGAGLSSKAFRTFSEVASSGLGDAYERYRVFLYCLFDELAVDLGVLFDRASPYGLLFPRQDALLRLFALLGDPEAKQLWAEDETIGWIYQYWNDPTERKKMREESSAPRNSRELAVRNQFFTPRYVVEFLTDNTLGRIWYEMTRGETKLRDLCRYLVRRPKEVFLQPGETAPEQPKQENPSQEALLTQTVHIPYRQPKDPRTILMLDPACGSMHFGLYAFDLFEVIYEEAWELEERLGAEALSRPAEMKSLRDSYANKDAFQQDVPRLIVENNLHGIDIDARCAQIAGLSLWLRAQKAWQRSSLKPKDRPVIRRSNIVCAEPMPGETEQLREFCDSLKQPAIGQLVRVIFDKMRLAGEAGSLLRIEEEIRDLVHSTKLRWTETYRFEQAPSELFTKAEIVALSRTTRSSQPELDIDFAGITDEAFWDKAEQRIYDALEAYAEQAENGGGFQRRLFSDDAAQGFAFIDLCRKRYDVAVMNPPFGEWSVQFRENAKAIYPSSYVDILSAFIERSGALLETRGRIGAITSRTCLFLHSFAGWRERILLGHFKPELLADLGHGVMDAAMVEAAAYILTRDNLGSTRIGQMLCFRLLNEKPPAPPLAAAVAQLGNGVFPSFVYCVDPGSFRQVPNCSFAYWVSESIRKLFSTLQPFETGERTVRVGLQTSDDFRFVRTAWEIPLERANDTSRVWFPFPKGGSYSPFYADVHLVTNWQYNGKEVGAVKGSVLRNTGYYFRPGLTWTNKTTRELSVRALPAGCIFSGRGPCAFAASDQLLTFLGWLHSAATAALIKVRLGLAAEGRKSYEVGVIGETVVPQFSPDEANFLAKHALEGWTIRRALDARNLTSHAFTLPALAVGNSSLKSAIEEQAAQVGDTEAIIQKLIKEIDEICFKAYEIRNEDRAAIEQMVGEFDAGESDVELEESAADSDPESERGESVFELIDYSCGVSFGRWDIRYATGERLAPELPDPFAPLPVCPPGMLQGDDGLPLSPEAGHRLRTEGRYPLDVAWNGILVDDPEHPLDLEPRVHAALAVLWGDRADALEHEACALLGVPTMREWFRRPASFFADHLKRYSKSRRQAPIYWPLSTASGSYTLWIYYHRLSDQTLFQCVNDFVKPKIAEVTADLSRLTAASADQVKMRAEIERLTALRAELVEFRDELLRVAGLPYKPNLNDGVLITACPLWKLFRLPKWQKDLKACWEALAKGDYDWAHLAYTMWPDRVRDVCKKDRSIAIAHGLESLCEIKPTEQKGKRGRKKNNQMDFKESP